MTDHPSNGEQLVEISDAELRVETFGNPTGYPPGRPGSTFKAPTEGGRP